MTPDQILDAYAAGRLSDRDALLQLRAARAVRNIAPSPTLPATDQWGRPREGYYSRFGEA